jgi:hypothetical protein
MPFPDFADEPTQALTPVARPVDEAEDDLLEEGWERPRRTSRLTLVLVAALLVGLGFAGGALVARSAAGGGGVGSCAAPPAAALPASTQPAG